MTSIALEPFPGRCIAVLSAQVDDASQLKDAFKSLDVAIVDASFVLDCLQLTAAACSVLAAESQGNMLTKNLNTELLYRLSPSRNVSESLRMMGLKDGTKSVCVIAFDVPLQELRTRIKDLPVQLDDDLQLRPKPDTIATAFKLSPASMDLLYSVVTVTSTKDL